MTDNAKEFAQLRKRIDEERAPDLLAYVKLTEDAIAAVRRWYDESIFPPRPPGIHTEVYDGEAAVVARLTCDNILRQFRERLAESKDRSS